MLYFVFMSQNFLSKHSPWLQRRQPASSFTIILVRMLQMKCLHEILVKLKHEPFMSIYLKRLLLLRLKVMI